MSFLDRTRLRILALSLSMVLAGCPPTTTSVPDAGTASVSSVALHSSTIAVSPDGTRVYVVNPDSDSVSVVDPVGRTLIAEISLAPAPPSALQFPDGGTGPFTPAVQPRTLALSPDGATLYVAGERSGSLHVVDLPSKTVTSSIAVGSEPIGVLVSADGSSIYVSVSQDSTVVKVDASSLAVTGSVSTAFKPWALAFSSTGALVVTQFQASQLTEIDPVAMKVLAVWSIPETEAQVTAVSAPLPDPEVPHGKNRELFDLAPRPGTDELWLAHVMLGTDTPQPTLDFETTTFPTLSVIHAGGIMESRLSINAQDQEINYGAFADIVSGPHAVAFTRDGAYALMVDSASEDVMVVDAVQQVETSLVRPLPGHLPEGIALSPNGEYAYVDERNTGDVAVLDLSGADGGLSVVVDGAPINRLVTDPMPANLRLGQHLFNSANSDEYPITTNHWVACASCHPDGRSDAVIWHFLQGPRDTPSNAGGVSHTGFLLRTADMRTVQDYWRIINNELGGQFNISNPDQVPLLNALADYVNLAIPLPIPPTTNPALVARGKTLFESPSVGCTGCHQSPLAELNADGGNNWFTDSATGNPTLDLDAGPVLLHDIGTCVLPLADGGGPYPDVAHLDMEGDYRDGCSYDTPTLLGIADTPPYLHDGRAATLMDVFLMTQPPPDGGPGMGNTTGLDGGDLAALAEYLRSL